MLRLGVRHILDGTDHLLFLFLLLVPAPLLVLPRGHWGPVRRSAWKVVRIVSGFTLGHCLTLLLAALGIVRLPETAVEVGIGLTILLTVLHLLLCILAFNLGIELVQLGMVALVLPWLLLLAPDPRYRYVRLACGLIGAVAALAWIAERVTGSGNRVAEVVQAALGNGAWVLGGLAVLSLASLLTRRYRPT